MSHFWKIRAVAFTLYVGLVDRGVGLRRRGLKLEV